MFDPTLSRDASGRLAVEVVDIPMDMYSSLCQKIELAFALSRDSNPVTNGVDVVSTDFRSELGAVEMAWDNWSGFIVTAKVHESEPLVLRIYEWFMDRNAGAVK